MPKPRRLVLAALAAFGGLAIWGSSAPGETDASCPAGFSRTPEGYCRSVDAEPARVYVPAGSAYLGKHDHASPRRRVVLEAFAIAETEVSVAQYRACVEAGACERVEDEAISDHEIRSSFAVEGGDHLPANYVDWDDAQAYCRWAGGDLCTSDEWEKAAMGGCELFANEVACEANPASTPWGGRASCELAAYNDPAHDDPGCRSHYPSRSVPADEVPLWPVDSHPRGASPYGALNMFGNVWEWTKNSVGWELDVGPCADCRDTRGGGVLSAPVDSHPSSVNPTSRESRWAQRGIRCCWSLTP